MYTQMTHLLAVVIFVLPSPAPAPDPRVIRRVPYRPVVDPQRERCAQQLALALDLAHERRVEVCDGRGGAAHEGGVRGVQRVFQPRDDGRGEAGEARGEQDPLLLQQQRQQ